jgi:hypothetical protein
LQAFADKAETRVAMNFNWFGTTEAFVGMSEMESDVAAMIQTLIKALVTTGFSIHV